MSERVTTATKEVIVGLMTGVDLKGRLQKLTRCIDTDFDPLVAIKQIDDVTAQDNRDIALKLLMTAVERYNETGEIDKAGITLGCVRATFYIRQKTRAAEYIAQDENSTTSGYYWLRTPDSSSAHGVRHVTSDGTLDE